MAASPTLPAVAFQYNGTDVLCDTDRMISLTDMWKSQGSPKNKRPVDWSKKEGKGFIASLEVRGADAPSVVSKRGKGCGGTWAVRGVADEYFRYLSRPKATESDRLYFILCESANLVKIGITNNIERRMGGLATQSPVPVKLLGHIEGGRAMESHLHARFAKIRHHGEWFQATPRLLKFVREALAGKAVKLAIESLQGPSSPN
jgi:hypothetical protein